MPGINPFDDIQDAVQVQFKAAHGAECTFRFNLQGQREIVPQEGVAVPASSFVATINGRELTFPIADSEGCNL